MRKTLAILLILLTPRLLASDTFTPYTTDDQVPQAVPQLWSTFDPRKDPIEKEVVKTYREDGVICEYVLFTVATIKGVRSRIAAFYTYPEGARNLPAFVWAHGGGQRADRSRGLLFAKKGYATIDINWNGSEIDPEVKENTDWGMVDPTQGKRFYAKALREKRHLSMKPDEYTIDSVVSPRNKYWFMLGVAGRRAITFLEQQPEVNPDCIGFTGFSMGGNITSYCATDARLKAVAPIVGGTGHQYVNYPGYPSRQFNPEHGDLENATIVPEAQWPHVKIPTLFISSTNDFHGRIDYLQKCADLITHQNKYTSLTIHDNHGPGSKQYLALEYWFDQHLKKSPYKLPQPPVSQFTQESEEGWSLSVTPDRPKEVLAVHIYYSHDTAIANRYHQSVKVTRKGDTWQAQFKVKKELPLTAFANVIYRSAKDATYETFKGETSSYSLASRFYTHIPESVNDITYQEWDQRSFEPIFARFPEDNLDFRELRHLTYKFNDKTLSFPAEKKLRFHLKTQGRPLTLGLAFASNSYPVREMNELSKGSVFLQKTFKTDGHYTVSLSDLVNAADQQLSTWHHVSQMRLNLIDPKTGQKLDLHDPEISGQYLTHIEWVD